MLDAKAERILDGAMTAHGAHRRSRREPSAIATSFAVAAALHLAAIGIASATRVFDPRGGTGDGRGAGDTDTDLPPLQFQPSCDGDAVLAVAARALSCASPFVASPAACLDELAARLESDRLRCHVEDLAPVAFSFQPQVIAPPALDPEPLLDIMTPERQRAFEQQQEQQQVARAEEAVRTQQVKQRNQQVIETARPTVEVAPDDARFVSEHNTKVDRQTVARGSNREELVARSKPSELAVKPEPREPAVSQPTETETPGQQREAPAVAGALRMRPAGPTAPAETAQEAHQRGAADGTPAPRGDGALVARGDGALAMAERQASEAPRGEGGAGGGAPAVPNLRASEDVLERAIGGGSVDHLEGIEEGDETSLSSKQWVYASFFNRMKRRVHQNWNPVGVWRRHDPTGAVYGTKSRLTRLRVTLGAGGDIKRILVVTPSGVDVLDDEAMRAFRAAQPFPNPPGGLVDASGGISFDFGFHLEINNGRSQWRVFRTL